MAECTASASCIKILMHPNFIEQRGIVHRSSHLNAAQRLPFQSCKVLRLPTSRIGKTTGPCFPNLKVGRCLSKNFLSRCMGSFISSNGLAISDSIAAGDQVLLVASMFLTYLAGVIPIKKSNSTSHEEIANDVVLGSTTISGSARDGDDQVDLTPIWDVMRRKLLDSLDSIEQGHDITKAILEYEQQHAKQPLSLSAIAEGPKLRLLWAAFEQLEQEVQKISSTFETISDDGSFVVFPKVIRNSLSAICSSWLRQELSTGNLNEALVSLMIEKLNADDTILMNVRRSGKGGLYSELLSYLRFGFHRKGCSYNQSFFTLHGHSVLEDLVIAVADGVASIYLELISVDGDLSNEMSSLGLTICSMSTRALQKLRNEVALNQWLYQNVEAVVSMYEDRFDLWTLKSEVIEGNIGHDAEEKKSWWNFLKRSEPRKLSTNYVVLRQCSIPVKRTKELRALSGWRYYFSLFLELSDITMPMVRTMIEKISNAISFSLVCLIGRSLGLIYTGIRQSLRWK